MTGLALWAHRRWTLVLVLTACVLALSLLGIRGLTFDADVLRLLPAQGRAIPTFRTFLERFGSLDQLYVVFTAPEGHSAADYSAGIDEWIDALRSAPEIETVDAGTIDPTRNWNYIADRQLLLLAEPAATRAVARLRPDGMPAAIAATRELLAVPSPEMADMVRQDPLGLLGLLREQLGSAADALQMTPGEDGYVSSDGRQRLVIARPARPPYDTTFSHTLIERLAAIETETAARASRARVAEFEEDPQTALPPLRMDYAGGHRIAVETEAVVRRESIVNGIGSLAVILPLLFLVFRSAWLVVVGALPSALSLVIVLGVLGFTGATLSAATTGASAMLFGLGVDGVVLLYVAHRLAIQDGANPEEAIRQTRGTSSSMLLGMWTTAATFYGLMVVDFPSLEQLGRLVGHSMVLCGILTLVIVPALLPRGSRTLTSQRLRMPRLAAFVTRRPRMMLGCALVITVILGGAATRLRVNPTLERLRSVTPGAVLQEEIGRAFGLPSDVFVILSQGADLEGLLGSNEELRSRIEREAPAVRVHAPAMLLPSQQIQADRAARIDAAVGDPGLIRTALRSAAAAGGFRKGTIDPFDERLDRLLDPQQRLTYDGLLSHGLGDILNRFVVRNGDEFTLATYVFPTSPAEIAAIERIAGEQGGGQRLTGIALVNRELAERFLPQFLLGLGAGSALVVILIVATFRDIRLSVLSLLPTVAGLLWAGGILAIAGVELDLFAVFAVVTFVGIGVDYGVHMVHRYRDRGSAELACAELAPVILVAGAITLLGYGTLTTSSYPPLRSIGTVSLVSVVTLVASSLFVLPALLVRRDS